MIYESLLLKMRTELAEPVRYYLQTESGEVCMNDFIGSHLTLAHSGDIFCVACGDRTYKSFAQGFCFNCFRTSPLTEECVMNPEMCRAHEGVARDMDYAEKHCLSDQFVYLALSSDVKVGVTRHTQVPTRWMDQGAIQAIKLAKVPNRYTAGLLEVHLKDYFKDKTSWQKMLKGDVAKQVDLLAQKQRAAELLPDEMRQYVSSDDSITYLSYPVQGYPTKVKSLNLDTQPEVAGVLTGIKGQYLMLDEQNVINIRKFSGYKVRLSVG